MYILYIYVSSARFVGGLGWLNSPLVPLTPKFVLTPHEKIVKISQKYLAAPSGFPTNRVLYVSTIYISTIYMFLLYVSTIYVYNIFLSTIYAQIRFSSLENDNIYIIIYNIYITYI